MNFDCFLHQIVYYIKIMIQFQEMEFLKWDSVLGPHVQIKNIFNYVFL